MEEKIRDILIAKCQQLAEDMNVRTKNVVAWLTKDVEGRLMPLIRGEADVRRIPFCGIQTATYIDVILQKLRVFYKQLMERPVDALEDSTEPLFTPLESIQTPRFSFPPQDKKTEQRIQMLFEQMRDKINNTRARNLVRGQMKSYKMAEPYIDDPSLLLRWKGAGPSTIEHIFQFLEKFLEEYSLRSRNLLETETNHTITDYPFLTPANLSFTTSFLEAYNRYPVWFIALNYLRLATDRPTKIFARINGIFGHYDSLQALAEEYSLTFERIRQLSKTRAFDKPEVPPVWNRERWAANECFFQPLLTEANTNWKYVCQMEHLGNLDFYAGLAILSNVRPIGIVALMADGTTANGRRAKDDPWQQPEVLFGYDLRLNSFRFTAFLKDIGHDASLQRVTDETRTLQDIAQDFFQPEADEETRTEVYAILKEVLPMLAHVKVEGDKVILQRNRINYPQEIYQILQKRGEAMTVDDIYSEFRLLHPDDHHTDSNFIRSYMLLDERFEAVGRKSTYQLREWQRFSGALGDLAVLLLRDSEEPLLQEQLCQKMIEARSNTTLKSCISTIYLAVMDGRLAYFMTEEHPTTTAYVGLSAHDYPQRYWHSTLTVEGVISSMHRFVTENKRWPFASNKGGIEGTLCYALRKYSNKLNITDEDYTRFQQGMADIPRNLYPKNERDTTFIARCRALIDFRQHNHRLPTNKEEPKLMKWYRETLSKRQELDELRENHFRQITMHRTHQPGEQLSFNFNDNDNDQ